MEPTDDLIQSHWLAMAAGQAEVSRSYRRPATTMTESHCPKGYQNTY
jgi:hypothetical protein